MNLHAGPGTPDDAGSSGDPGGSGGQHDSEPVGSLGEEAAKLLGALSHWAREQHPDADPDPRADHPTDHRTDHPARTTGSDALDAATHTLHGLAESVRRFDDHLAAGAGNAAECRYCPVCRMIHALRRTSPEVRQHLGTAAGALLEAATALLADAPPDIRGDDEPGPDQRR